MKAVSSTAVLIFFLVGAIFPANALEYRKCTFDVQIAGSGLGTRTLPQTRFTAWARRNTAGEANTRLNDLAAGCTCKAFDRSNCRRSVRTRCVAKSANSSGLDQGLSGYELSGRSYPGRKILIDQICGQPGLGKNFRRSIADRQYDKRILNNIRITLKSKGGTGRCDTVELFGPLELTVYCNVPEGRAVKSITGPRKWTLNQPTVAPRRCQRELAIGMRGASKVDAQKNAANLWVKQAEIQFGRVFSDWNKAKNSRFVCRKTLQGRLRYTCILYATPCNR